jgi:predicted DNA-binding transcriptional regulator AlpA
VFTYKLYYVAMSNFRSVALDLMNEAAMPRPSKIYQNKVGWVRYLIGCAIGMTAFCGLLWLAS